MFACQILTTIHFSWKAQVFVGVGEILLHRVSPLEHNALSLVLRHIYWYAFRHIHVMNIGNQWSRYFKNKRWARHPIHTHIKTFGWIHQHSQVSRMLIITIQFFSIRNAIIFIKTELHNARIQRAVGARVNRQSVTHNNRDRKKCRGMDCKYLSPIK